ncbi:hypothetical protein [Aquidulcibacter sp.]|uniref:hypothetical protein n=1 Tax=Aquidulcibacter sp. TaxID=2052990 RepID=UPI0025BD7771|nr:hypothetical protein [Aquidulcibacter sp.]MCA3692447.1 hypothetical protein [Aquidulcibacter sp.]
MQILITDITDMADGMYCVAGWNEAEGRMIRPLPQGRHWHAELLEKHRIAVGSRIEVIPTGRHHNGDYPHTTEDLDVVTGSIQLVDEVPTSQIIEIVPAAAMNLTQAFEGHLRLENPFRGISQKLWVPVGSRCRSLVSINRPFGSIEILVNKFGTLRAKIESNEGDFNRVEVTVSCSLLKHAYRKGGVAHAMSKLPAADNWHLRLGLAREFEKTPGECALMLNGVL